MKNVNQDRILILGVIISIITIGLNDIIFSSTEEIFYYGDIIGEILSNLSLAYISSYMFYFVVVVIKDKRDKRNVYSSVYQLNKRLLGEAFGVYRFLVIASGIDPKKHTAQTVSFDDFEDMCKQVNPRQISPNNFLGRYPDNLPASWSQLIYNGSVKRVTFWTERIFVYMPYLDSELVRLIDNLTNNKFHHYGQFLPLMAESNMLKQAKFMYDFLLMLRDLETYNETEVRRFLPKNFSGSLI